MSKFRDAAVAFGLVLSSGAAGAGPLDLGRPAAPAEIAAWDIDIRPDGVGLPEGRGDVETGEEIYAEKCAVCHGDFGEGVDRWPALAGGWDTLASDDPVKTVGSYWPYLSTVWDYVHRAMPFGDAQSLSADEVYAITAYVLYSNDLVEDDFELSRENFSEIRLPNEANFFMDDREESPLFGPREVCMSDCKADVKITARARIIDVTPEETNAAPTQPETQPDAPETSETTPAAVPTLDAALAAKGEKVFKKCKACHQVGDKAKNRNGPVLNGIYGAPVGAVEGFKYSKAFAALNAEGAVWDAAALHGFLEKPRKWAKGTKMSFAGLRKEADRAAVIEYLKSVSAAGSADPDVDPAILAIAGDREYGEYLASECMTCHRADGTDEGIPSIAGWPKEDFVIAMQAYKTGARPHPVMRMMAGRLSDEEIASLAVYFETLD